MSIRIPWAKPSINAQDTKIVSEAVESTWISHGPFVTSLENEMTELLKVEGALCTSNGTTALYLSLLALGVGPGDEVIIPNFTFTAPGNMVVATGATPVFVDIDPKSWCLSPEKFESAITKKTKAVIAVHIYGNVADMKSITSIAKKNNIFVIEDTAEALFSEIDGRAAGSWGDIGTFSFHATKTITTGEGGLACSHNPMLLELMAKIRDHGMQKDRRYWHTEFGHNFRITNMQAALGTSQLRRKNEFIAARKRIYEKYIAELNDLSSVQLQSFSPECTPVVWAMGLALNDPEKRDHIIQAMLAKGIELRPGFFTFSKMPLYKNVARFESVEVSESISEKIIALPFFTDLTDENIEEICSTLKEVI